MYRLDIIVPFYNEEEYLQQSVDRLVKADIHNHIYLVNNNSTDSSKQIALDISDKHHDISYLETTREQGKGVGLRSAITRVKGSHIVVHDADLEYFPEDLQALKEVSINNPAALILGSRFIGTMFRKNNYLRTKIANQVMSKFFSLTHRVSVTDVATCYKLIPLEALKSFTLKEKGFAIEIELIAKYLKTPNAEIFEVPIRYQGRTYEQGKKITFKDGFKYLYSTLKY